MLLHCLARVDLKILVQDYVTEFIDDQPARKVWQTAPGVGGGCDGEEGGWRGGWGDGGGGGSNNCPPVGKIRSA